MDRTLAQTIGLAVLTALLTVFVARVDAAPLREASGTIAADSAAPAPHDSAVAIKWLNDANVLSLVGAITGRQIAASTIAQASARSDSLRAVATSLAQEDAGLQRSADSLAGRLGVAPAPAAVNAVVTAEFQAQIDSLAGMRGAAFDHVYLDEQVASRGLMGSYFDQLAGAAQSPDLRDWLATASDRVAAQATRVKAFQRALAAADSIVADSLAKRAAARRKR